MGGVVRRTDLSEKHQSLCEEAVDEDLVEKRTLVICPECDKRYTTDSMRDQCECGIEIDLRNFSTVIQYSCEKYPEVVEESLGDSIKQFSIVYDDCMLDQISPGDLVPSSSSVQRLHISPLFMFDNPVHIYENFNDVFVSWSQVSSLVDEDGEIWDEVEDFLSYLDDGRVLADRNNLEIRSLSPNPQTSATDTTWYTKLHRVDKSKAHQESKSKFGRNYNEQFERLGNEFLHILFPHAMTLQGGGKNQPDGYVFLKDQAYLVEAKCYSNQFKIFKEQDKANRYVKNYSDYFSGPERSGQDLAGYIFIAHEFNKSDFQRDIRTFRQSNRQYANIDVICVEDTMMAEAVELLSDLYREEPSAPWRIYSQSNFYRDIIARMKETTTPELDQNSFSELLRILVDSGKNNESDIEQQLRSAMRRESLIGERLSKALT
ncbi:hypothetical protein [Halogeometricum limi]|nr:hypothetical protein [Halogeometricum limi]